MSEAAAVRLWDELCTEQHTQAPSLTAVSAGWLDALPSRVAAGELPAGLFETDAIAALRLLNHHRLYTLFIRYRTRLGKTPVRGYIPLLPGAVFQGRRGPKSNRPWVRVTDQQQAAAFHAQAGLVRHLDIAARLHGSALVELGAGTWDEVEANGHAVWTETCQRLAIDAAGPEEEAQGA